MVEMVPEEGMAGEGEMLEAPFFRFVSRPTRGPGFRMLLSRRLGVCAWRRVYTGDITFVRGGDKEDD